MYGKHFASMYTGSMVGSGLHVFSVWGYIIANTYKSHIELNPAVLAAILGCEVKQIEEAIKYLCQEDAKSRNKKHKGARLIKEGEYQYFITGHEKYRSILNEDERRQYNRDAKRREREASRILSLTVIEQSAVSAHTDTESESESESEKKIDYLPTPLSDLREMLERETGEPPERFAIVVSRVIGTLNSRQTLPIFQDILGKIDFDLCLKWVEAALTATVNTPQGLKAYLGSCYGTYAAKKISKPKIDNAAIAARLRAKEMENAKNGY